MFDPGHPKLNQPRAILSEWFDAKSRFYKSG
jgi:hypothetical protein